MFKWLYRIIICLGVLSLLYRGLDWSVRQTKPLPTLPQPNGYDDLLAAAKAGIMPAKALTEFNSDQLRQLVQTNAATLELMRQGLTKDCRVTLKTNPQWLRQHDTEVTQLKHLGILLGMNTRVLMLDGHTNEAAQCQFDTLHLGQAIYSGGRKYDALSGFALELIGTASLEALLPQLTPAKDRQLAQALEKLEARREGFEQILETEKIWSARYFGIVGKVGDLLLKQNEQERTAEFKKRYDGVCWRTRRLTLRLAARAYELEKGKPPTQLAELVPDYLKSIPINPETGKAMTEMPALPEKAKSAKKAE